MNLRFLYLALICAGLAGGGRSAGAQQASRQERAAELKQELVSPAHVWPDEPPPLQDGTVYAVLPSDADPTITRFNKPNLVLVKNGLARTAPLLLFFPGTTSEPQSSWPFLEAGADAGYRVIGLMYDNGVALPTICGPQADPACSDRFRQKRIFGDAASTDIDDLPAESVVHRLVKLLQYLNTFAPDEGWGQYLQDGRPDWSRIAVSGHSQGGGVAAYIAKKRPVYRVINLSGAWDRTEATKEWAPWITAASATPMDRWYCAYHANESRADAMKLAYRALQVPPDHIRVLTLEPDPTNKMPKGADVYHLSMSAAGVTPLDAQGKPAYAAAWAFLLGTAK
jgi:pimeloyl-ACP methyl ester carboxylesterase